MWSNNTTCYRTSQLQRHRGRWLAAILLAGAGSAAAQQPAETAAEQAVTATRPAPEVYFISPQDGAQVMGPFVVRFGLRGMGVAPAGVPHANAGHHHLLIDLGALPPLDKPLPPSESVRHYGGGQTEVTLELPPGEHTLQLVMGNHLHIPHDPPVISERITVTVLDPADLEDGKLEQGELE